MKRIETIGFDISVKLDKLTKKLVEAQRNTAEQIQSDVKMYAPHKTGVYEESIKVEDTIIKNGKMTTFIGSDLLTSVAKWTGNQFNLGFLLEHGTGEHAIPNAFGFGYYYGYTDANGVFHKGTLDKDWHPGFAPFPHYFPALEDNKDYYKEQIKKAIKEAFK